MTPKVLFSQWSAWSEDLPKELPGLPGIYLLARFGRQPTRRANPKDRQIVYIGESCKSISKRLRPFQESAKTGRRGHSGRRNYFEEYGGSLRGLHVAHYAPRGLPKDLLQPFIKYVERKLIWDYARKYEKAPRCNKE